MSLLSSTPQSSAPGGLSSGGKLADSPSESQRRKKASQIILHWKISLEELKNAFDNKVLTSTRFADALLGYASQFQDFAVASQRLRLMKGEDKEWQPKHITLALKMASVLPPGSPAMSSSLPGTPTVPTSIIRPSLVPGNNPRRKRTLSPTYTSLEGSVSRDPTPETPAKVDIFDWYLSQTDSQTLIPCSA